jgi:hypothetical protein
MLVNPLLATADSLIEGMVIKAITVDKDIGLNTEIYPYNFLP